ncbi:putative Polycomb group protein ASXL2 [Saccostrea cucullata]|uniref:putative Polycomb group protein ASXL2 n=1 Tax=Saccostrea cuccullata TaxID=36930 RepID=UPI002ED11F15
MQTDKQVKKKSRTWAEAAKLVLEKYKQTPMSHKAILKSIQEDNLKDISGSVPLACLNSCLHAYSRGKEAVFYKVEGRSGVYGLMSDRPAGSSVQEVTEDIGEESDKEKPFKERRKENVMYVKLPKGSKTIPQTESDEEEILSVVDEKDQSSSAMSSETLDNGTNSSTESTSLRRSMRQQKKKRPDFPRIIIKPIPPPKEDEKAKETTKVTFTRVENGVNHSSDDNQSDSSERSPGLSGFQKTQTMREMLAGIPGISMKPRKSRNRKLSHAAQIAQTKEGCIDLETPDSILVNTNLRALFGRSTFNLLPVHYQYKLLQLLPECDRILETESKFRMSTTAFNNEFFNKACEEWRERLSEGEFTPENQLRLKQDEEKEQTKLDPWKAKHFEPVWGKRFSGQAVPKADIPSPPPQPPIPKMKIKPALKKSTTKVSTLIKQEKISQTVSQPVVNSTYVSETSSQSGLLLKISHDKSEFVMSRSDKSVMRHQTLKRSLSGDIKNEDGGESPSKKNRVTPVHSPLKTVIQVCTANQMAKITRPVTIDTSPGVNQPKQVSLLSTATSPVLSQMQQTIYSAPRSQTHISPPKTSQDMSSQTRTLAQIKVQTNAVRGAPVQIERQTRTLAQIKAETRAKIQMRNQGKPQEVNAPTTVKKLTFPSATVARQVPNILHGRQRSIPSKAPSSPPNPNVPEPPEETKDGIKLKRSLQICKDVIKKTGGLSYQVNADGKVKINTPVSTTEPVAILKQDPKPPAPALLTQSAKSASKVVFANPPASENMTTLPSISGILPVSSSLQTLASSNSEASEQFVVRVTKPPTTLQPQLTTARVVTVPGSNAKFLIPSGIPTTAVGNSSIVQILNSAPGSNLVTMQSLQPSRASSAPPQNEINPASVQVQAVSRSASVGLSSNRVEAGSSQQHLHYLLQQQHQNQQRQKIVRVQQPMSGEPSTSQSKVADSSTTPEASSTEGNSVMVQQTPVTAAPESSSAKPPQAPAATVSRVIVSSASQLVSQMKKEAQLGKTLTNQASVVTVPSSTGNGTTKIVLPTAILTSALAGGENASCACSLKAMIMCKKCGAFCHHDCIGPSKLCVTCLITTS